MARIAAAFTWSGVSKSGSPAERAMTSRPALAISMACAEMTAAGEALMRLMRRAAIVINDFPPGGITSNDQGQEHSEERLRSTLPPSGASARGAPQEACGVRMTLAAGLRTANSGSRAAYGVRVPVSKSTAGTQLSLTRRTPT